MGGGLLQLVAYGAQDVVLTSNPSITFFKTVHRRHTNFAMECISNNFSGTTEFGRTATCTISRNGDLIHKVYLKVTMPPIKDDMLEKNAKGAIYGWARKTGHALIKNVEIEIGGQRIDKHYGEWMEVWSQLTLPAEKKDGHATMIRGYDGEQGYELQPDEQVVLYIPLQFWFCTNPGLSLPLIALQYHEVKVKFEFRKKEEMLYVKHTSNDAYDPANPHNNGTSAWTYDGSLGTNITADTSASDVIGDSASNVTLGSIDNDLHAELLVDYIYLDTDERRRFAQVSHEYLITQLQHTGEESFTSSNQSFRLNFNHPVKELVWVTVPDEAIRWNEFFQFEDCVTEDTMIGTCKLMLNGHDRFAERDGHYFSLVQPFQHHTCVPVSGINVYSFALKPEDIQPSGTCNFSRIDNATMKMTMKTGTDQPATDGRTAKLRMFATNYNLLRIMSGMGGLAYAN